MIVHLSVTGAAELHDVSATLSIISNARFLFPSLFLSYPNLACHNSLVQVYNNEESLFPV